MGYRFQDFAPIAITLLVIGVTIPISADIMRDLQYSSDAVTHTNESQTFTNATCLQLNNRPLGAVSYIGNSSLGTAVENEFDLSKTSGAVFYEVCIRDHSSIALYFNTTDNGTTWNVTYSSYNTPTGRIAGNTSLGLEELGSWQDTIALVIAAAVVLGLIYMAFSRFGGGGGAV